MTFFNETLENFREALTRNDSDKVQELLIENAQFLDQQGRMIAIKGLFKILLRDVSDRKIIHLFNEYLTYGGKGSYRYLQKKLKSAIRSGLVDQTGFLLRNGAKLNDLEKRDWRVADYVFRKSHTRAEMLQLLLNLGMDSDNRNKLDENLISQFLRYHYRKYDQDVMKICNILIDHGVSVTEPDDHGWTPLQHAVENENFQFLTFLVEQGRALDNEAPFPLNIAIRKNLVKFVEFLLLNGADINAKEADGFTAMHWACYHHNEKLISLLLRRGADINAVTENGETPLSFLHPNNQDYDSCVFIMVKEIAKSVVKNFSVSKHDLEFIESIRKSRELFQNCINELRMMKTIKLYASFSYFCMMDTSKNLKKLSALVMNKNFIISFETNLELNYYKNDLQWILDEAILLRDQFLLIQSRLSYAFNDILPGLVIKKLAGFLELKDLPLE